MSQLKPKQNINKTYQNQTELRMIVVDAFKFLDQKKNFLDYIPFFVAGDKNNLNDSINKISQRMRYKNSIPTNYAILQLLMRLNEYAAESEDAFTDERTPSIPRSKGNVDYTLKALWVKWAAAIEDEQQKQSDWQDLEWNPYAGMVEALDLLITRIWHKHFDVKNM